MKLIVELFEMTKEHKECFLNKMDREPQDIHMILGLRAQESLLTTVRAEQLGYIHPWELPNISIQRNPSKKKLVLVGMIGLAVNCLILMGLPSTSTDPELGN